MVGGILSHANRKKRVQVFSLDSALTEDVVGRVRNDPRMAGVEVLAPQQKDLNLRIQEIDQLAQATVRSKVLVLDVRSATLPRLQQIYNKISGFNRKDLNQRCYILLIGDGPASMFQTGGSVDDFGPILAKLRLDYHPSMFFYDPMLHYSYEDLNRGGLDQGQELPDFIPGCLAQAFKEKEVTVNDVRRFFRGANVTAEKRQLACNKRLQTLIALYRQRIEDAFGPESLRLEDWFNSWGQVVAGETLKLHLYPLYFDDAIFERIEGLL